MLRELGVFLLTFGEHRHESIDREINLFHTPDCKEVASFLRWLADIGIIFFPIWLSSSHQYDIMTTHYSRAKRVLIEGDSVGASTEMLLISNPHRQRLFVLETNGGVGRRRLARF